MLGKNSLINLSRKFLLGCHSCTITILRKIILKISNRLKIFKEWRVYAQNAIPSNKEDSQSNIIFRLYKKQFHDMLEIKTMKRIIERFQMEYMLADAWRLGRPRVLSDIHQTKITEPRMRIQECFRTVLLKNAATSTKTVYIMQKKKEGYFPY